MPTIKFHTLGCKVNQYDTQSIRERFLEHGFREAGPGEKSDFYLINTCTVTAMADQKSRGIIRRCINENPEAKVIVTGCLVKKDRSQLTKIKGVSFIIEKSFFAEGISSFCSHTRAFLKIQDGCDNFCSYCKVPLARGRSRSKSLEDVVREAARLAKNGFKEIVLTGICLGSYGRDLNPKINLVKAIEALERIDKIVRIRLSSIEAGDVTSALIEKMADSQKLCPHLHIPIQSGDDEILKKMRRRYSAAFYLKLIRKARKKIPNLAITTDCLVGFPGEGERNFRNTLNLVRKISPLRVHIFPYSAREGTRAYSSLCGNIPAPEIKERVSRLKEAADLSAQSYKKLFLGRNLPVLFEARSKARKGYWEGYADNYIKVLFKSRSILRNRLIRVRLKALVKDAVLAS